LPVKENIPCLTGGSAVAIGIAVFPVADAASQVPALQSPMLCRTDYKSCGGSLLKPRRVAVDDLDAKAKALFLGTAKGMGWTVVTPWDELHEDTREMYRREALRRIDHSAGAPRND
jgi:hypothetical protein